MRRAEIEVRLGEPYRAVMQHPTIRNIGNIFSCFKPFIYFFILYFPNVHFPAAFHFPNYAFSGKCKRLIDRHLHFQTLICWKNLWKLCDFPEIRFSQFHQTLVLKFLAYSAFFIYLCLPTLELNLLRSNIQ